MRHLRNGYCVPAAVGSTQVLENVYSFCFCLVRCVINLIDEGRGRESKQMFEYVSVPVRMCGGPHSHLMTTMRYFPQAGEAWADGGRRGRGALQQEQGWGQRRMSELRDQLDE